jgi:twitching motility protein PilT
MNILNLLKYVKDQRASDLHLKPGAPPTLRIHGRLLALEDAPELSAHDLETIFNSMTSKTQQSDFQETGELDFSYQTETNLRFRVNASQQRGEISLALRRVSLDIPTIDELHLPEICKTLALKSQGLVLVTGPTGSGKSTTLAAMIEHLNQRESRRIVTVEDPIEFIYRDKESFITQRELGTDTRSFAVAAQQALRQDPDVILVGEMRDQATMAACITAAETGHLVLSTLHTNNAPQSIDRLVDSFPPHQQGQIRMQLSLTLQAVLAQQLLPRQNGQGRVPAVEVMLANNAVRNLVREGKTHQLKNVMQTGSEQGMQTMERALENLFRSGLISREAALANARDPDTLRSALGAGV